MLALAGWILAATAADTPADFLDWMDRIAKRQLDEREARIKAVTTPEQARARQAEVRQTVLRLIGGLPDYAGPLNAKVSGRIDAGAYTIDRLTFESLPRFVVSANLYLPKQPAPPKKPGKHPGIVFPLGHWEQGKPAAQRMAGNLATKGFAVLTYDPIGQGERQQGFDPRAGRAIAGAGTEQHFMAGANALLINQSFARYRIWDAKRALDYLASRPEVDANRIGATGCSGGGTVTTYISALDPRIKVTAPACYMNSFRLVFTGPVGDSEQSPMHFISSGLDETDYVEMFAPKPWLIGSTELDFFTPAGARVVYEEARRWYGIFGAEDKVQWVVGPGGHGTPTKVREAIYAWMMRWLGVEGSAAEEAVPMFADHELRATPNGQVAGREIYELIRQDLDAGKRAGDLKAYVRKLVDEQLDGPEVLLRYQGEDRPSKVTLIVQATSSEPSARFKEAAAAGAAAYVVPRGLPMPASAQLSGDWISNTRAWLIGGNLPAMRAKDILRAVDSLARRGAKEIALEASDVAGVWALMAAALDPRITELRLERTPHSVRASFQSPVHRNLHDAVMPGFALLGDYEDLAVSIEAGGRKIAWTDPTDWMRNVVPLRGARYAYTKFAH